MQLRKIKRQLKKHKKVAIPMAIVFGILLLAILFLFVIKPLLIDLGTMTSMINKRTCEEPEIPDETVSIREELYIMTVEDRDWLYGSGMISYDDIDTVIVLGEDSDYSAIKDKKEQAQWLHDYYLYFGYSKDTSNYLYPDRISDPEFPVSVTVKEAYDIAIYCGYSEEDALTIVKEIKPYK